MTFTDIREFIKKTIGDIFQKIPIKFRPDGQVFIQGVGDFNGSNINDCTSVGEEISNLKESIENLWMDSYTNEYLTFENANGDDICVLFYGGELNGNFNTIDVSIDNGHTWTQYTASGAGTQIAELTTIGSTVLIKGNNLCYGGQDNEHSFYADGPLYVYGNIMSLIDGNNFRQLTSLSEDAFYGLFYNSRPGNHINTWLLSHPTKPLIFPAINLEPYCYRGMFKNCANLTKAPKLPATTVRANAYESMFCGCTSLQIAPELLIATVEDNACRSMFEGCTSLKTVPKFSATTIDTRGCMNMFKDCTSLTNVPKILPALNFFQNAYKSMFENCTSLVTAPELPLTDLSQCGGAAYEAMFKGCTSLINPPKLPATILDFDCYKSMFENCTSLTIAPDLLAESFESGCYNNMFAGCTSLSSIKILTWDNGDSSCTMGMLDNTLGGTAIVRDGELWSSLCSENDWENWTVIEE